MKVYVFGHTGMLGRYVYTYLLSKGFDVVGVDRGSIDAISPNLSGLAWGINKGDIFINCVGAIPQRGSYSKCDFIRINSVFPHFLSEFCVKNDLHLIHATTDCVFSGSGHKYNENSLHTEEGIYGKSKSLGEPAEATIIRTSIIGEELSNKKSLLEWVKSKEGEIIDGYTNHIWNGITCLEFAKICADIISTDNYWKGVKHIHSPGFVNKFELITLIAEVYNLDVEVIPVAPGLRCDKTLSSVRADVKFDLISLEFQLNEQMGFYSTLEGQGI